MDYYSNQDCTNHTIHFLFSEESVKKDVRPRDGGRDYERHVLIGLGHTTGIARPKTLFPDLPQGQRARLKTNTAHERNNSECEDPYILPLINDADNSAQIERSIVMLETSGVPWLIAR